MDPIELEAMLNSDNKEERIRARRLVRPRVPRVIRSQLPSHATRAFIDDPCIHPSTRHRVVSSSEPAS
jgi:hypothetical protein